MSHRPLFDETAFAFGVAPSRLGNDSSRLVRRAGIGLFWTLVVAIVAARVLVFQPDIFAAFHEPQAVSQSQR